MAKKLDAIDLKIVRIMQANGRISNLELSKEIGLSPAPTLGRVRNLQEKGVLEGFHAKVNLAKLGIHVKALIEVKLDQHRGVNIKNFIDAIMKIPEVVDCYQVTGDFDYLLRVFSNSVEELNQLITQKISVIEEVGQIKSHVILNHLKHTLAEPKLD